MDASSPLPKTVHYKLVLLGDASVGKSCLVVRFAKDEFYEYQEPTIGAAFMTQSVTLGDEIVKFEIWDTAGQERYRSLAPMYYRGAAAAVVVYDITNKESFDGAKSWINELKAVLPSDVVIALTGNKIDLEASRCVSTELAEGYAEDNALLFKETSAKTGEGVRELFDEIARKLPKKSQDSDAGGFQVSSNQKASSWSTGSCAC